MTATLLTLMFVVSAQATMNIGLRDQTVVQDVPVLQGRLPRPALEVLGVRAGRDRLSEARSRLGTAPLRDTGAPHDGLGICYVSGSGNTTLFVETGELEQGATEADMVDTFVLLRGASPGCGRVSGKQLSTTSGLRLGLTPKQVESQLGPPSKRSEHLLLYLFKSASVIGVVEVHLQHGVASQLVIGEWPEE